jgi:hypothetical protein
MEHLLQGLYGVDAPATTYKTYKSLDDAELLKMIQLGQKFASKWFYGCELQNRDDGHGVKENPKTAK